MCNPLPLPCGHRFCAACVHKCRQHGMRTCSLCRADHGVEKLMSDAVSQIVQYETLEALPDDAPGRGPRLQALLDAAADLCQQALHTDPGDGHALQELGWVSAQRGATWGGGTGGACRSPDQANEHDVEALRCYRAAIAADSSRSDAHHMVGVLLIKDGDSDGAERAYIAAIVAAHPAEKAISMSNVGLIHASRKNWASALRWFERALGAYDGVHEEDARISSEGQIARCLEGLGKLDRALNIMQRLKRDHPRNLQVVSYHAELNRNVGNQTGSGARLATALEGYRDVLRLDPENDKAHYNVGQMLVHAKCDAELVMEHFEAFLSLQTENDPKALGSAYGGISTALYGLGDTGGAIDALRKSVSHEPKNPGSHCNLGIMLGEAGADPDEVEACFSAALRLADVPAWSTERAITHSRYGDLLAEQDKRTEAEAHFRAALALQVPETLAEMLRKRLAEHLAAYA